MYLRIQRLVASAAIYLFILSFFISGLHAATMNYLGAWSPTTTYSAGSTVTFQNKLYYSLLSSNLNRNPQTATTYWSPIDAQMKFIGSWSSTTIYSIGDIVTYQSQLYYSLLNSNTNQTPTTATTYWSLLATQGNTVRYGAGAPLSTTGVDGDFYIDTSTNQIYGPRSASAWPSGKSIKGPEGSRIDGCN